MSKRLGAYPSDSYFDPARPSWLPFWIDTPNESAMKYEFYPGVTLNNEQHAQITPPTPQPPAGAITSPAADLDVKTTAPDWKTAAGDVFSREYERIKAAMAAEEWKLSPVDWALLAAAGIGLIWLSGRRR